MSGYHEAFHLGKRAHSMSIQRDRQLALGTFAAEHLCTQANGENGLAKLQGDVLERALRPDAWSISMP